LGKYAISVFAKSAIADNNATLHILQWFGLEMHTQSKGFLMRDRNNEDHGVGHSFCSNNWSKLAAAGLKKHCCRESSGSACLSLDQRHSLALSV